MQKVKLPDPSSFSLPSSPVASSDVPMGTPLNLDLEQWAYAYIDAKTRPERASRFRSRIAARGYQRAEGVEIAGIDKAEVWVLPRSLYVQQMQRRQDEMRQAVYAGRMSDCAISVPKVDYRAPRR